MYEVIVQPISKPARCAMCIPILKAKKNYTSRGNDDAEVLAFVRHFCRETKTPP